MYIHKLLFTLLLLLSVNFCSLANEFDRLFVEFENSLSDSQSSNAILEFNNGSREFWSYLPGAMMPRPGVRLDALNETQRNLVFQLLKVSLSDSGYQEVRQIMSLESLLADMGGDPEFRDPLKYSIVFYGHPIKDDLWSWSFQGHHLVLNFTNVGEELSMSPRFLGASPMHVHGGPLNGQRTLSAEMDRAFELLESLDEVQMAKTIFREEAYLDIVSGSAMEVAMFEKVGLAASEMNASQRVMLKELIYAYLDILPMETAVKRMEQLQSASFNDISFGWAGSIQKDKAYYYRIQGNDFLIEFDCTFGDTNHVHTVWRDFKNDFGRDLLKAHRLMHAH